MITGDMVVLDHGDLANAMRASMAIPGAFSPVVGEGYILSDGGMVRNIPVDVARNTCADIVIVVNLVEPPATAEKLVQATQLLSRRVLPGFQSVSMALYDTDSRPFRGSRASYRSSGAIPGRHAPARPARAGRSARFALLPGHCPRPQIARAPRGRDAMLSRCNETKSAA